MIGNYIERFIDLARNDTNYTTKKNFVTAPMDARSYP